jgi:hypothetical protein
METPIPGRLIRLRPALGRHRTENSPHSPTSPRPRATLMNLLQKLLQWLGFAAPAPSSRRKRRTSYRSMPVVPSRSPQSASSLSSAELWSLAACGVLTQNSGDPFDRLGMRYSGKTSRICLADWWGVTDRPSLIGRMEWLLSEGHRAGLETRLPEVAELLLSVKHGEQLTSHNRTNSSSTTSTC